MTPRATPPTSPFRVILPDGATMAFPITDTLDDIRAAAQGHADALRSPVEITRFDGHPMETVRPSPKPDLSTRRGRLDHGRAIVRYAFADIEKEGLQTRACDTLGDVLHYATAGDGQTPTAAQRADLARELIERAYRDFIAETDQPMDEPLI